MYWNWNGLLESISLEAVCPYVWLKMADQRKNWQIVKLEDNTLREIMHQKFKFLSRVYMYVQYILLPMRNIFMLQANDSCKEFFQYTGSYQKAKSQSLLHVKLFFFGTVILYALFNTCICTMEWPAVDIMLWSHLHNNMYRYCFIMLWSH